jgi:hypothetical protein
MKRLIVLVCVLYSIVFIQICSSQTPAVSQPKVVQVKCDGQNKAGLGDRITVVVDNLAGFLANATENNHQVVLFINGMMLEGIVPEAIDTIKRELRFYLRRTDTTKDVWTAVLGRPSKFIKEVSISVGQLGGYPIATAVNNFQFVVIPKKSFYFYLVLLFLIAVCVILLAFKTDLLRDPGPKPENGQRIYSLARTQMAFWFLLVLCSYIFIWCITWELDTISDSVLILIGISAGTAISAVAIDTKTSAQDKPPILSTGSFVKDLLTDGYGVSLHRLQMFVWTIVLGIIFCISVYRDLAMPEFGGALLTLMGISSGTYLGFKIPENIKNSSTVEPGVQPDMPAVG